MTFLPRAAVTGTKLTMPQLIHYLEKGTVVYGVYFLCIDEDSRNLMDIIHWTQIVKPVFRDKKLLCAGVSEGKKGAYALVAQMLMACVREKGSLDKFKSWVKEVYG